jgi:EAL domain-containing protein (putative c-di-GMP-specific phosphodiesterase class I)/GGDEF domain-containing protein/FixJ family two-component response regulator
MTIADASNHPHESIKLARLNRLYSMLSHINRTIVRAEDPHELYTAACRIAVERGGYTLAWIELIEPDSQEIVLVAHAGSGSAELRNALTSMEVHPAASKPVHRAIQQGKPCIVNDTLADPLLTTWHEDLRKQDLLAAASFPLTLEDGIVGAFTVTSTEAGFFNQSEIRLMLEVAADISFALDNMRKEERRAAAESTMRYLAYYDTQTGLPNRMMFEGRLVEACKRANGKMVAVLLIRLRRYHSVLRILGQDAGLGIARAAAGRLEGLLPATFVARVSESEFALMMENVDGLPALEEWARQIYHTLAAGVESEEQEIFLDPFIGIAAYPQDGPAQDLIKYASVASAMPHNGAGNAWRFFTPDMVHGSRQRLDLDVALHRALERDEFILHFQPQLDIASGRVVGAEALLRWQRPGHGLVPPTQFISLLEDNGLIRAVGEWVLHEACRINRHWQDAALPPMRMAVNLSAHQFHDSDIRGAVRRVLTDTKLDPRWLELELTEGIVLVNADAVIRTMQDLKSDGASLALDDFGTGYSSLSYLQRLPVARLKIDQSFVSNITSSPRNAAIARAVVGMAHSLGMAVIAEGVEKEGQLAYLRSIGCEEMQGHFFSRALPADEFAALLRDGRCIAPSEPLHAVKHTLLVIDDEPNVLAGFHRLLGDHGFRVLATTHADQAFNLLASNKVEVVICDQHMPDMSGTEFLRRAKDLYPDTVRIVLSDHNELHTVIDAVNRGVIFKVLTKPWEDDAMLDSIRDAFRQYEIAQESRELSRLRKEQQSTRDAKGKTLH